MTELLLFCGLYSLTLLFFAWVKAPKTLDMECRKCNVIQKKYIGDYCQCGTYLSWTDRIGDGRKMILKFEKMGLITKIDSKNQDK